MSLEANDRYMREIEAVKNYDQTKRELEEVREKFGRQARETEILKQRVRELESSKTSAEGKTLAEIEKNVIEAKDKEVNRRASEKFELYKDEWRRKDRPKEVFAESVSVLSGVVEQLAKPGPHIFLKEIVDAGLHENVSKILHDETSRRMDAAFSSESRGALRRTGENKTRGAQNC